MVSKVRTIVMLYLWVYHNIPVHVQFKHIATINSHFRHFKLYTNLDGTLIWTCPTQACLCINEVFQVMKRMKAVGSRPSTAWHCEGGGKRCELYDHGDLMGGWVWMAVQAVWRKNETRMKHQWKWCKHASSAANQTRVHSWSWRSSHLSRTLQYRRSPGPNPVRFIHSVASCPLRHKRGSIKNTDSQTITATTHWTSNTEAGADLPQSSPSQIQGLSLAATKPAKETTQTTRRSQQPGLLGAWPLQIIFLHLLGIQGSWPPPNRSLWKILYKRYCTKISSAFVANLPASGQHSSLPLGRKAWHPPEAGRRWMNDDPKMQFALGWKFGPIIGRLMYIVSKLFVTEGRTRRCRKFQKVKYI